MQREQDRRIQAGEPSFGFFAPSYQEVKRIDGKFVNTQRPLLFNYVFVRASERDVSTDATFSCAQFPASGEGAEAGVFPLPFRCGNGEFAVGGPFLFQYTSCLYTQPDGLRKGDRIRITEGAVLRGVEATVVIQPGAGRKDVMVCVENWMWVPLLRVSAG